MPCALTLGQKSGILHSIWVQIAGAPLAYPYFSGPSPPPHPGHAVTDSEDYQGPGHFFRPSCEMEKTNYQGIGEWFGFLRMSKYVFKMWKANQGLTLPYIR